MPAAEPIGTFILAGGRSSRMGQEKGLLPIGRGPMVIHLAQLAESVGDAPMIIGPPEKYSGLGLRVIADERIGAPAQGRAAATASGPLVGICTALHAATRRWNLILGCDLPFLTREWLQFLAARALDSPADVVIPLNERGYEPMCAMYRKRCHEAIAAALERGVRKITDGLAALTVAAIAPEEWKRFDPRGMLFKNINTPADYEEARAALKGSA